MYKGVISAVLLFIFGVSYIYKLYFLKTVKKIDANVLGKGEKDINLKYTEIFLRATTFAWLILWLVCIISDIYIPGFSYGRIGVNNTNTIGLIITGTGVLFFESAIYFMKSSWRVGVDMYTKTELITDGIYKYSRNPAFVGFDLMFIGLFFTYPNFLTFIVLCLNLAAIHLQILQEEKFLKESFGNEYALYIKSTPRYLFF